LNGGDIGIVEALMRGGAVIQNEVQDAAYAGHWRLAEHLLGRGASASATALGLAARAGELGLVRQMVAAKPALAALDGALREAVSGGDVAVVEVLLRAGARPNETGYPPVLAWAASYGDTAVVRLLLAHGAKWRHFSEWRDKRRLAATEKHGIDALATALVATRPDPGRE
jgi:ankyrin repeat protein